jgi:hypothetical protein
MLSGASRRKKYFQFQSLSERRKVFTDRSNTSFFAGCDCLNCGSVGAKNVSGAFISKLDEAMGEAMETQAWLDRAFDSQYLNNREHEELDQAWQRIGGMLHRMIQRADDFCRSSH